MPLDITTRIPVVDGENITRRAFEEQFLKPQKPVILRGLWKRYPAYAKWNYTFFKESMGDIEVGLFSSTKADPGKTLTTPTTKMKFSDYLALIEQEPTDLRLFLFPVFKHKPALLNDFGYPDICSGYIKLPFMFFGPKGSITRMHQDIDMSNVFLTQFEGRKRVVLFAPDQSDLLYKLPFNVHSTVDIDHPDYEQYPALKYVTGMEGILEYGDTLFMPSGYWHHIEYLEGGFGLSVRTVAPTWSQKLRGAYYLTVQRSLDQVMRWLLREKWFQWKKQVAAKRANRAIAAIEKERESDHHQHHTPALY